MHAESVKSLFLAWQAPNRAWFPVGRLNADGQRPLYVFQYTKGALQAQQEVGFKPLLAFPNFDQRYESPELFPLFKNRVLDPHRKDFFDYLRSLDLDPEHPDPLEILAISGGERQTDSLEVFPKIEKKADNSFSCRFFLHGLSHVSEEAQQRALSLQPGDPLGVSLEINNPKTVVAIQLTSTQDYHFLGWAPRYLVSDLLRAIAQNPKVRAHVVRVNELGIPLSRRVLIELAGDLPAGFEPMSGAEFQTIH
jgi:hypothetical protein